MIKKQAKSFIIVKQEKRIKGVAKMEKRNDLAQLRKALADYKETSAVLCGMLEDYLNATKEQEDEEQEQERR